MGQKIEHNNHGRAKSRPPGDEIANSKSRAAKLMIFSCQNKKIKEKIEKMLFSIMLTRGAITVDAVMLGIDHEIEIHFADRRGNVQGNAWSHKYGSVSTIRKGQLEFCRS